MALNYTLKENRIVEAKVTFLRVVPNGKRQTLADIYSKFQDQSWIKSLTPLCIQESYRVRVNRTLEKIVKIIEDSQAINCCQRQKWCNFVVMAYLDAE